MRRLVAVFSSKRDSASKSTPSHPHPPQNPRLLHLPLPLALSSSPQAPSPSSVSSTPQLSSASDYGLSSDSSTRSASVHAPAADDDHHAASASLSRNFTKRSWKNWLGGKRVSSDPPTLPVPPVQPSEPPRRTRMERPSSFQVLSRSTRHVGDAEKEFLEEEYDTVSLTHSDPAQPSTTKPSLVMSPAKAQQFLKLSIKNSLISPSPPSPFVQPSSTYLFPVSCNRPGALPCKVDQRRVVLKRRLLERLERLSVDDEAVILPFGSRSVPTGFPAPTLPDYEARFPSNTTQVFRASPGLRRWISRPCFEDRFSVFLPSNDGVRQAPVTSTLAVAALEYSESLDILADPEFDPTLAQPPALSQDALFEPSSEGLPAASPPLTEKASPPATVKSTHSFILSPSPLRNQHNPDSVPPPAAPDPASAAGPSVPASDRRSLLTRSQSPQPISTSPTAQHPVLAPVVKRAVRFAEDDAEDVEPLHLLRQKKLREEKAKFLRAEKRRRLMQQEQERRRIEAERIEEENWRWAREKEKKEMEQRQYAELVIAQRARRESQRAGIIPGLKMDENYVLLPSTSSLSLHDTERHRSHDTKRSSFSLGPSSLAPRRGASESSLTPSQTSFFDASSYRGGSIGHSPGGSNSGQGYQSQSRPSSTYSSSSDGRRSARQSMTSNNPHMPFMDRAASYPVWSASNQSIHSSPGVSPYPELMNDSLLLPPSAPFMMHQHSRQSKNSSPRHSNSSGSLNANSPSSSSERVHMHRQSASRSSDTHLTPSPGTSLGKPSHIKSGRNDPRNSTAPAPVPSRGSAYHTRPPYMPSPQPSRPQVAQYTQSPTPWTALPTERGNLPTAMPLSPYSHSLGTAMNRGTNVSFKGSITGQSVKKNHGVKR